MRMPKFKVGDAVMLQTGGYFMTIAEIDSNDRARCLRNGSCGLIKCDVPLRGLVRLDERLESLKEGDCVMCRATFDYYHVRQFDADRGVATCVGKKGEREVRLAELVQMHMVYE